jgi:hypothetical protein
MVKKREGERAAQQFNGHEGAGSYFTYSRCLFILCSRLSDFDLDHLNR